MVSPTDLDDYRRFLALKVAAQDWYASLLSPPAVVDRIWHAHLLDTLGYEETCAAIGVPSDVRIIHHNPNGGNDAAARAARLERSLKYYKEAFGAPPPVSVGRAAAFSAPAAPAPSAQQLAAQQLAAAQQQLAELEAKHGKIQEAFAQMHTVPPEQQPGVQQQLLALRQQPHKHIVLLLSAKGRRRLSGGRRPIPLRASRMLAA